MQLLAQLKLIIPDLCIPEFRECVHDDAEHNVQTNSGHNDEEGDVKDESDSGISCSFNRDFLEINCML